MRDQHSLKLLKRCGGNGPTRRAALQRLGSGVLFAFSMGKNNADEEKIGPQKQVLLTSRLHVSSEGIVTLLTGKVECGQGIRTTLTQVAAEELHIEPTHVRLIMGDTALVPDDGGTWGSLTTPDTVPVVRQACAAMRELLCRCAAAEWQLPAATLTVSNGQISAPDGRLYSYRELATNSSLAKALNVAAATTKPADWQICGTAFPNVNGPAIVTGSHQYSSDLSYDGMLYGRVLRAPNHRCRLMSFDAAKAERLPGIQVAHEGDFLGITAPTAAEAARALQLSMLFGATRSLVTLSSYFTI